MIIGQGSASFEMLRHQVTRLPDTRSQPVGFEDAMRAAL
jgi:hypothetical protein